MTSTDAGAVPDGHPDRIRWNARYSGGARPAFEAHPLAVRALAMDLPDGPVADLACGPSGTALLAAASRRQVVAVDVSDKALALLRAEARRRGLGHLITLVHADLAVWRPEPRSYALVLCTGFWSAPVFAAAAGAVAPGGVIGWEAFAAEARRARPGLPPEWCLAPGEPASLLPEGFTVIDQSDLPGHERRRMLARLKRPALWREYKVAAHTPRPGRGRDAPSRHPPPARPPSWRLTRHITSPDPHQSRRSRRRYDVDDPAT